MKLKFFISIILLSFVTTLTTSAQKMFDDKRIKELKEWKIEGKKKTLDHLTKYDEKGNKVEEIEYNSVGDQKSRVTYEYNANDKCIKESYFDEYNKLEKTVTTEYHPNGKKKLQNTFQANGKLKNTKEFEYILE
ncbi:MAG TPA: hypothetical protein PKW49_04130 [Paludibacteraceae bacterium]|nr:hypothetical protein [Paludibacteraceae bacterium]